MAAIADRRPSPPVFLASIRADALPLACLLLGVGLRFALALVNRQANDDHIDVVRRLLRGDPQPDVRMCWECFQPKFFHQLCAGLAEMLDLTTREEITVGVQVLNVLIGMGVLFAGYDLIYRVTSDRLVRSLATSWLALNAPLIGINAQATNDTLIILAGTVVIVSLHRWILSGARHGAPLLIALLVAALAPHIKGNGLVVAGLALGAITMVTLSTSPRHRVVRAATIGVVFLAVLVGGSRINRSYQDNRRLTGSWLTINMPPEPLPHVFRHSEAKRPGITSMASGYFTFRLGDLVRTPYVPSRHRPYPLHKTSLWSQLYGRTYVLHFEQAPASWANRSWPILTASRLLLVLGVVPAGLLIAAFVGALSRPRELTMESLLFLAFVLGFLGFVVAYSLRYRDVATMKAIFLFPGLAAFMFFYVQGLARCLQHRWARRIVVPAHLAILALWIFETVTLIRQLGRIDGP
jgi:hypothetical protein